MSADGWFYHDTWGWVYPVTFFHCWHGEDRNRQVRRWWLTDGAWPVRRYYNEVRYPTEMHVFSIPVSHGRSLRVVRRWLLSNWHFEDWDLNSPLYNFPIRIREDTEFHRLEDVNWLGIW